MADVVAVLDDLDINKAHFMGYSMGGKTGFGIAKYAPERFMSLIIGGMGPGERPPGKPSVFLDLFKQGMDALVAAWEQWFGPLWTPQWEALTCVNDLEALIARVSLSEQVGYEDMLPIVILPCFLFVGEKDALYPAIAECSTRMPNATLVPLPEFNHIDALVRSDVVVPHIRAFLESVEAGMR